MTVSEEHILHSWLEKIGARYGLSTRSSVERAIGCLTHLGYEFRLGPKQRAASALIKRYDGKVVAPLEIYLHKDRVSLGLNLPSLNNEEMQKQYGQKMQSLHADVSWVNENSNGFPQFNVIALDSESVFLEFKTLAADVRAACQGLS